MYEDGWVDMTHIPSGQVIGMPFEQAVWQVLRFGGYDHALPVTTALELIRKDLNAGLVACTNSYEFRKREGGL